jgi:hypothetical protein
MFFLDLIFRFALSIEIVIKKFILKSCLWNNKCKLEIHIETLFIL